jgi:DNA-binding MarR family transcriptional regulator
MHPAIQLGAESELFINTIEAASQKLWPNEAVTFQQRRVLRVLREHGPMSLAELGRARCVSRQRIRVVVQTLEPHGVCETSTDGLISLTPTGGDYISNHDRQIAKHVTDAIQDQVSAADFRKAAQVVRDFRLLIEAWLIRSDVLD